MISLWLVRLQLSAPRIAALFPNCAKSLRDRGTTLCRRLHGALHADLIHIRQRPQKRHHILDLRLIHRRLIAPLPGKRRFGIQVPPVLLGKSSNLRTCPFTTGPTRTGQGP